MRSLVFVAETQSQSASRPGCFLWALKMSRTEDKSERNKCGSIFPSYTFHGII